MKWSIKIVPICLLILFSGNSMIKGFDYPTMGIILGFISLIGFIEYKDNETSIKQIKDTQDSLTKTNEILIKEIQEVKSYMNAARISDGMRNPLKRM